MLAKRTIVSALRNPENYSTTDAKRLTWHAYYAFRRGIATLTSPVSRDPMGAKGLLGHSTIHMLRTRFPHPSAPKSEAPQVIRTVLATQAARNGFAQTGTIKHTLESGAIPQTRGESGTPALAMERIAFRLSSARSRDRDALRAILGASRRGGIDPWSMLAGSLHGQYEFAGDAGLDDVSPNSG
jgi:hypothetical protein